MNAKKDQPKTTDWGKLRESLTEGPSDALLKRYHYEADPVARSYLGEHLQTELSLETREQLDIRANNTVVAHRFGKDPLRITEPGALSVFPCDLLRKFQTWCLQDEVKTDKLAGTQLPVAVDALLAMFIEWTTGDRSSAELRHLYIQTSRQLARVEKTSAWDVHLAVSRAIRVHALSTATAWQVARTAKDAGYYAAMCHMDIKAGTLEPVEHLLISGRDRRRWNVVRSVIANAWGGTDRNRCVRAEAISFVKDVRTVQREIFLKMIKAWPEKLKGVHR